jgi:hypothetical protein
VAEAGHHLRLAAESREGLGVLGQPRRQHLEGEAAVQDPVPELVDSAHTAGGELPPHQVAPGDHLPDERIIGRQDDGFSGRPHAGHRLQARCQDDRTSTSALACSWIAVAA